MNNYEIRTGGVERTGSENESDVYQLFDCIAVLLKSEERFTGQITRENALQELNQPLYEPQKLKEDTEYVLKKFDLSPAEFDVIMHNAPRKHEEFKTDTHLKAGYMNLLKKTQKFRYKIDG